jgi:hypothetical protein
VQFVRTVPEHVYDSVPDGDFRILEAYTRALRSAQKLIYLENQFLWSSETRGSWRTSSRTRRRTTFAWWCCYRRGRMTDATTRADSSPT